MSTRRLLALLLAAPAAAQTAAESRYQLPELARFRPLVLNVDVPQAGCYRIWVEALTGPAAARLQLRADGARVDIISIEGRLQ